MMQVHFAYGVYPYRINPKRKCKLLHQGVMMLDILSLESDITLSTARIHTIMDKALVVVVSNMTLKDGVNNHQLAIMHVAKMTSCIDKIKVTIYVVNGPLGSSELIIEYISYIK